MKAYQSKSAVFYQNWSVPEVDCDKLKIHTIAPRATSKKTTRNSLKVNKGIKMVHRNICLMQKRAVKLKQRNKNGMGQTIEKWKSYQ